MARRKTLSTRIPWSKSEIRLLKKLFRNMSTADVARELDRTVSSVQTKATVLGLRKTKKYLKSIGRG